MAQTAHIYHRNILSLTSRCYNKSLIAFSLYYIWQDQARLQSAFLYHRVIYNRHIEQRAGNKSTVELMRHNFLLRVTGFRPLAQIDRTRNITYILELRVSAYKKNTVHLVSHVRRACASKCHIMICQEFLG